MTSTDKERRDAMLDRVLARGAQALGNSESNVDNDSQFDLAERAALKRVAGLSTELEDITEVEYRQVRLEKVVLAGLWNTTLAEAENSIRELAALAETAGSEVLDAIVQRRETPDPGTYLGKG
ncbi:MAG: GTPase HflX, partial [Brevibacterium sp.]|nr:GTPase HflX [Brevibacterium sp.]